MEARPRRPKPRRTPRHIGMRVWLAAGFTLVAFMTVAVMFLSVINSSEQALSERARELGVGRTIALADRLEGQGLDDVETRIFAATGAGFSAWYFGAEGTGPIPNGDLRPIEKTQLFENVAASALDGVRAVRDLDKNQVTLVAVPVFTGDEITGAVVGRYSQPVVIEGALDRLRSDSTRAALLALIVGTLFGVGVASLISARLKRIAADADQIASGNFDVMLPTRGRDEIGDLARSLDSMRTSLRDNFGVLTADRDKLTAIFDGLTDAVMVVDNDGPVRFYNSAATVLLDRGGLPPDVLIPQINRAASEGFAAHPALRIGDRAYAMQARSLPDEKAVLVVIRDRTDEMRKEFAERDFVSNAAHELRNPLAGISGAIEVLQSGAKDDPKARDHFLGRLAADAERMSRLTQSLLTLARVEALGAGEVEVVDVPAAASDVEAAVDVPVGLELIVDVEPDLAAKGDPTLLRQVLIGLVTNAIKNTPPPGSVTIRGRQVGEAEMLLEVTDTGTGIPQSEIDRVFERFYRRSESRRQEGFGLGLAIARRMADVMGGEMGAHSIEGEGSTFWVRLPLERSETPIA